ncbi:MAG: hypothetical protein IJ509_03000 [Bacilli bacterium]|nr:hypothetical protein [Bacilli bacterium]
MNVIVSNLNGKKFVNLDIDVIKSITGEFTVDEIVQSFSNFFFNRMFLDITSIKDYTNVNNLKALSIGLDVSKIILLLPNDNNVVNSDSYISKLISMGIYNFARTEDELKYLYDNPNSYKDVAHLQKIDEYSMVMTPEVGGVDKNFDVVDSGVKIIGIKNFTSHAGATSLIYMLKKQLSKNYYTVAIEINKRDFMFFNDKDMISCKANELNNLLLKYKGVNVLLIDLNDLDLATVYSVCSDVVFLMESSTLMINKAVMLDNRCFNKIADQKVILNRSLLSNKDVKQLSFETGINFFGVLPPLNDRLDNLEILFPILNKLGLYRSID